LAHSEIFSRGMTTHPAMNPIFLSRTMDRGTESVEGKSFQHCSKLRNKLKTRTEKTVAQT
jgi:hypothetical protein